MFGDAKCSMETSVKFRREKLLGTYPLDNAPLIYIPRTSVCTLIMIRLHTRSMVLRSPAQRVSPLRVLVYKVYYKVVHRDG